MASDLISIMNKLIEDYDKRSARSEITYCELISINPVTFVPKNEDQKNLKIKEEFLVVPKYRVFIEDDIGKNFVLSRNAGGQTYFYLYEASSPQGSNGEPYNFVGDHFFVEGNVTCSLSGPCTCGGTATVTGGTISSYRGKIANVEHKKRNEEK